MNENYKHILSVHRKKLHLTNYNIKRQEDRKMKPNLPTELLLQFSDQPHMNLLKGLPKPIRNMNNNSFPVARYIHLTALETIADNKQFSYPISWTKKNVLHRSKLIHTWPN